MKGEGSVRALSYPEVVAGQDVVQPLVQVAVVGQAHVVEDGPAAEHSRHGLRVRDAASVEPIGLE